jgi:ribosomal protein S18 acetylase RimI-like enzyme
VSAVVRPAGPGDAGDVAACVDAAYRHYVARIGKPPGPMLDDYAAVVRDHDVHVLEHEGRVAGIVVMIDRDGGVLLDNIAVHPDFAGSGLGGVLLGFALARAAARGFAALDLYTHALMHENIAWYRRRGFVESVRVSEKGFDRVYMRKILAAPGSRGA